MVETRSMSAVRLRPPRQARAPVHAAILIKLGHGETNWSPDSLVR